ncbi:MAG: HYR domain-containing protein, partial [Acidobacteria bacterium]|nr:HYR domain-containing protein [Acidobacteriota bacterium]
MSRLTHTYSFSIPAKKSHLILIVQVVAVFLLMARPWEASISTAFSTDLCTVTGNYMLCTDKADYHPDEIVHLRGEGFSRGESIQIKVTRPRGLVVTGDGSFAPWPTGYDSVTADGDGRFQFDYVLKGVRGIYLVEAFDQQGQLLASHTFTDDAAHSTSISATYNSGTGVLTVSGTYEGATCNANKSVGYALFINGSDPINPGTGSLDGAGTNTMHLLPAPCSSSGSWSDTHTLASAPSTVCIVLYEVNNNRIGLDNGLNDIAAGANHNTSNSFEQNGSTYDFYVKNGRIDLNGDGAVNTQDDGSFFGKTIINGRVDINNDGSISNADDGSFLGKTVINGEMDMNGDGTANGSDDGPLTPDPDVCVSPTIVCTAPPVINCPGNVVTSTDGGQCSAAISYSVTGTSSCGGNVNIACSPPSGSVFPKGTATVTCTATDTSGNSASCSFSVTVNDTLPPAISACPSNIVTSTDPGQCSAVVNFT